MLVKINIFILTLLIIDLTYFYMKIKIDKRLCEAYENLIMEYVKNTESIMVKIGQS